LELLMSSKRAWLLSYFIFMIIAIILFILARDTVAGKTAFILIGEMQVLMMIFFLLIIIFKWEKMCRTILSIFFLAGATCLGMNHVISKWYLIISLIIVLMIYMMWNIGGVVNCIVANKYKIQMDCALNEGRQSYGDYKEKVEEYNTRNKLGFWTKIRSKGEPNWKRLRFNSSGMDMFCFEDALVGVSTAGWERSLSKMKRINSGLSDKHGALDNNASLFEEREMIGRIKNKIDNIGVSTENFDKQEKSLNNEIVISRRKERKILRRKL